MRKLYDEHFQYLKKHAVRYNGYERYRILIDHHVSWERKRSALQRRK